MKGKGKVSYGSNLIHFAKVSVSFFFFFLRIKSNIVFFLTGAFILTIFIYINNRLFKGFPKGPVVKNPPAMQETQI